MRYIFIVFTKFICTYFALEINRKFINMAKLEAKICLALCTISLMSSVVYSCLKAGEWCYEGGSKGCCPNGYDDKIAPNQRPTYRCVHMFYRYGYPKDVITCKRSNLRKFMYNLPLNTSSESIILDPPEDFQIYNAPEDFQIFNLSGDIRRKYAPSISENNPFIHSEKISSF